MPEKLEFPRRQVLPEVLLWLSCLPLCATSWGRRYFAVELLALLSTYLAVFWTLRRAHVRALRALPGPASEHSSSWRYAVLGVTANFMEHYHELPDYQLRLIRRYGRICVDLPPLWSRQGLVYVAEPSAVEHVLKDNSANYIKPAPFRQIRASFAARPSTPTARPSPAHRPGRSRASRLRRTHGRTTPRH